MITHLDARFSEVQHKEVMALSIVPSVLMRADHVQSLTLSTTSSLVDHFTDFYKDDLPSPSTLHQEFHLWKCKWRSFSTELPSTPSNTLLHANESMFPNIRKLLHIISTLPVTSCECEWSISVLRRLKSYLRTTMGQQRMTGLALMHIKYGMDLNLDEIVSIFARQHPQRMLLQDILTD